MLCLGKKVCLHFALPDSEINGRGLNDTVEEISGQSNAEAKVLATTGGG